MDHSIDMTPKISVVVPAFNVAPYIKDTIDSLLAQTYRNFEIVVVDDVSTDNTIEIVKEYQDHRIVVVRHEVNSGLAAARNTGILNSRGEYISLLDGDDIAEPTRLAEQLAFLESDPSLGMVGSHVSVINQDGSFRGIIWKRPITTDDAAIQLIFRNTFSAVGTIRKSFIPDGGYRLLPMAEDYDFNVRIARHSKVVNLDKPLTRVRVRSGGLTQSKKELMEKCIREVMVEVLHDIGIVPTVHELDINRHIGALTMDNSSELLEDVEAWLIKLTAANTQSGRYDVTSFARIVANEWFQVCKFASGLGMYSWNKYWSSPLINNATRPNLISLVKFVGKCLIKHKREGGDVPNI